MEKETPELSMRNTKIIELQEEDTTFCLENKISKLGVGFFIKGEKREIGVSKNGINFQYRYDSGYEEPPKFKKTTVGKLRDLDVFIKEDGVIGVVRETFDRVLVYQCIQDCHGLESIISYPIIYMDEVVYKAI